MSCVHEWPEPIVRVQSLSESGLDRIPDRYVKPLTDRPVSEPVVTGGIDIPLIDLKGLFSGDPETVRVTQQHIGEACRVWGFFQAVDHGVQPGLMDRARQVWREFFHLPMEEKQKYANSPKTYEGYGSRLGVEKGAVLDWSDYYFLHYMPSALKDHIKWPAQPPYHRLGYCNATNVNCKNQIPATTDLITIHGLWPNIQPFLPSLPSEPQTTIELCVPQTSLCAHEVRSLISDLDTLWPDLQNFGRGMANVAFWDYEWRKHGTCSKSPKLQYFGKTLQRMKQLSLSSIMRHGGALAPDVHRLYTVSDVMRAFNQNNLQQPYIMCRMSKNYGRVLTDIYMCLDGQAANFVNCSVFYTTNNKCYGSFRILEP